MVQFHTYIRSPISLTGSFYNNQFRASIHTTVLGTSQWKERIVLSTKETTILRHCWGHNRVRVTNNRKVPTIIYIITLRIGEEIGAGQFGRIYKGRWQSGQTITEVAIKVPSETYDTENEIKLLQEAIIMGQFQHPNVLTLYGVVTQGNPVLLETITCHK